MGEAKARKNAAKAAALAMSAVNKSMAFDAVKKTMSAITDMEGADCLGYAIIGAGLLRNLGAQARAVAGYAAWRVGPGDGDMVVHDPNANAVTVVQPNVSDSKQAGMFHAWIEVDAPNGVEIVDFTTFQLRDKARSLDAMDGGKTQVDFCPDFIWEKAPPPHFTCGFVVQAPQAGVFSYTRVPKLEAFVMGSVHEKGLEGSVVAASFVYNKLVKKEGVMVIGLDLETGQHQTTAPKISEFVLSKFGPGEGGSEEIPKESGRAKIRP